MDKIYNIFKNGKNFKFKNVDLCKKRFKGIKKLIHRRNKIDNSMDVDYNELQNIYFI